MEGEEKYVTVVDASQSEEANVWSENSAPKMDSLMSVVATLSSNSGLHEDLRKDLSSLVDTRTNEQWASAEADNIKAKEEAARALSKPAPRKSAAIKIEVISLISSEFTIFNFIIFLHSLIPMT